MATLDLASVWVAGSREIGQRICRLIESGAVNSTHRPNPSSRKQTGWSQPRISRITLIDLLAFVQFVAGKSLLFVQAVNR
jgi:hypothetical protein